jgi:hypothetical protein
MGISLSIKNCPPFSFEKSLLGATFGLNVLSCSYYAVPYLVYRIKLLGSDFISEKGHPASMHSPGLIVASVLGKSTHGSSQLNSALENDQCFRVSSWGFYYSLEILKYLICFPKTPILFYIWHHSQ